MILIDRRVVMMLINRRIIVLIVNWIFRRDHWIWSNMMMNVMMIWK